MHVPSLFVIMDEESVHVLSLEDDLGCVSSRGSAGTAC